MLLWLLADGIGPLVVLEEAKAFTNALTTLGLACICDRLRFILF